MSALVARLASAMLILVPGSLGAAGCSSKTVDVAPVDVSPAPEIGPAECAACGMVVREQPSPRAQVMHRDGTRAFLCSVDEARHYVDAPSPHGTIVGSWVETVDADLDPQQTPTDARPWLNAADAHYVIGVSRPRIMGPPALVFETVETARAVAEKHGAEVRSWDALRAGMERNVQGHDHGH